MSDLRAARLTGVLFIIATRGEPARCGGPAGPDRHGLPRRAGRGTGPGGGRLAAPAHRGVRVRGDRRRDVPRPQADGHWPRPRSGRLPDGRGGHVRGRHREPAVPVDAGPGLRRGRSRGSDRAGRHRRPAPEPARARRHCRGVRLLPWRLPVLHRLLPVPAHPPVALRLGDRGDRPAGHRGRAGAVRRSPRDGLRAHGAPDLLPGDGPGGLAHRQGVQPGPRPRARGRGRGGRTAGALAAAR